MTAIVGTHATVVLPDGTGHSFLTAYHHTKVDDRPWRFVGGKIEPGETPIQAAAREVREEIGIVPHSLRLVLVQDTTVKSGTWRGYWFLCDKYDGLPVIPLSEREKFNELRYMSVSDLRFVGSDAEANAALAAMPLAATPQPLPNGEGKVVLDALLAELQPARHYDRVRVALSQRADYGLNKYGTLLRTFDGRDTRVDLVQELLDGMMYDKKLSMETYARAERMKSRMEYRLTLAAMASDLLEKINNS
jgi:8-oxo-dGTP pyrophosphatase MutT (NUDIX family)